MPKQSTHKKPRIRANEFMFAVELFREINQALSERRTVVQFVLDPLRPGGGDPIEFEICVTKIGSTRMPRSVRPLDLG